MTQLRRVFLSLLGTGLILISSYPAEIKGNNKADGKDILTIEIFVDGLKPLTVPVISQKKSAILPLAGAKASAVKVAPWQEGGLVKFEVLAVLDPLPEVRSCETLKQLRTELVTSYTLGPREVIQVSALEKFGVPPFSVKVTKVSAASLQCLPNCCCCGTVTCCPRKAACLACGDCGICCGA